MSNDTTGTRLMGRDGATVALKSVHVEGILEGLMLRVKVRQCYRNETGRNLETVYTWNSNAMRRPTARWARCSTMRNWPSCARPARNPTCHRTRKPRSHRTR